ncbi:MAG: TauD/TfdA family dioxygenase [Gammaproteobacteria bacterium]
MALIELPEKNARYWVRVSSDKKGESLGELDGEEIKELYKVHGALLFSGFDLSLEEFAAMTRRFCTHSVLNGSPGRVTLDQANGIQFVDPGLRAFPLHPEMSRLPWKPDICWFGCLNPPTTGGETTICDGVEIVDLLPPDIFDAFASRRLMYATKAEKSSLRFWLGTEEPSNEQLATPPEDCPFRFVRTKRHVCEIFTTPALHQPMFADRLAWGNFLFFARYGQGLKKFPVFADGTEVPDELIDAVKQVADKLEQPIRWRKHDLLMLDNTRFLHGRREIAGVDNRRIMSYFGYLNFARPGMEEPPNAKWRDPQKWSLAQ